MKLDTYFENIFKNIDDNIKIDDEQKEVILDESDNLIVVAGAGAGKTTTISAKVKYLVEIKKIKPQEILIISLTNKAIGELQKRINQDFKLDVNISTFHKLAYNILKKEDIRYTLNIEHEKILKEIIKSDRNSSRMIKILKHDKIYKKMDERSLSSMETLINFTIKNIKMIKTLNIELKNITFKDDIVNKYIEYLINIMRRYNEEMNSNMQLDFEDLILEASKIEKLQLEYKYIIVDEYQDISINRFNLLKNIVDKTHAKTIVVGDDFQTIFSFAGSNINLFLEFKEKMNAKLLKITNTYRNSQQLIDVAGNFIMKNDTQIKKSLHSIKSCNQPIRIYGYKNDFNEKFENILENIILKYGFKKNILILGRYNSDLLRIKSRKVIIKNEYIIFKKYPEVEIKFMTIHTSKGLGYDNVILINFSNEYMGFPSNIRNTNITNQLFKITNNLEEERRLFYVAITRTKNEVHIFTPINNESIFINDIYDDKNVYIDYKLKIIKSFSKHKIR